MPGSDDIHIPDLSAGINTDALDDMVARAVRADQRRVERAIRGAIRAGYDGVDINRPPAHSRDIVDITPWHRPPPDGANGYRTERYSWDWFSDDELTRLLRNGPGTMLVEGPDAGD